MGETFNRYFGVLPSRRAHPVPVPGVLTSLFSMYPFLEPWPSWRASVDGCLLVNVCYLALLSSPLTLYNILSARLWSQPHAGFVYRRAWWPT